MPSEMIERVARAICAAHGENPDRRRKEIKSISFGTTMDSTKMETEEAPPSWNRYVKQARAAIAAMREPTEKMVGAGTDEASNQDMLQTDAIPEVYRAMIDAALDEKAKP